MATDLCPTCKREAARMNSAIAECSHVDCPSRRHAWSDRVIPRPPPAPKRDDTEKPLDKIYPV